MDIAGYNHTGCYNSWLQTAHRPHAIHYDATPCDPCHAFGCTSKADEEAAEARAKVTTVEEFLKAWGF